MTNFDKQIDFEATLEKANWDVGYTYYENTLEEYGGSHCVVAQGEQTITSPDGNDYTIHTNIYRDTCGNYGWGVSGANDSLNDTWIDGHENHDCLFTEADAKSGAEDEALEFLFYALNLDKADDVVLVYAETGGDDEAKAEYVESFVAEARMLADNAWSNEAKRDSIYEDFCSEVMSLLDRTHDDDNDEDDE